MSKGLLEEILAKCTTIEIVQRGIPIQIQELKSDMRTIADLAASKAINKHEINKHGKIESNLEDIGKEITKITLLQKTRNSVIPYISKRIPLPPIVWKIAGLGMIAVGGKLGIDGLGKLLPYIL